LSEEDINKLILRNMTRFDDESKTQSIIDSNIHKSTLQVNKKKIFKQILDRQFEEEIIIDQTKIYKNNTIPIEDPEINRFYQTAILSYLSLVSHKFGQNIIKIDVLLSAIWKICTSYFEDFESNDRIYDLTSFLKKYGDIQNGSLLLSRPIVINIIDNPQTEYLKKISEMYEQISLAIDLPEPLFLYEKIQKLEDTMYAIQNQINSTKGTELVYTRGRKNRLIYNRIEEMILLSDNCFRIMMAYMSDEVKILYGLIEKLKADDKYNFKLLVRRDDRGSDNQNAGAIMDLKQMIIKMALDEQNRDDMLSRFQVKYFRANPSLYYKLHAKLLINDDKSVLAGSANLIPTSLESNIEVGFYSEDSNLVLESVEFFEDVWNQC